MTNIMFVPPKLAQISKDGQPNAIKWNMDKSQTNSSSKAWFTSYNITTISYCQPSNLSLIRLKQLELKITELQLN